MSTVLTKCFPPEKPIVANAARSKKRVLIVGGGFAGIAAARALKRADVEITRGGSFYADLPAGLSPALPRPAIRSIAPVT